MSKKQNNLKETSKTSRINNLNNLNEEELKQYNNVIRSLNKLEDKYGSKTPYKEIKNKINRANRKGTLIKSNDRNETFKYIHDNKYTVDIVARYSKRGSYKLGQGKNNEDKKQYRWYKTICVVDIYVYVRETDEVIFIDGHAWFNTDLVLEAGKYYFEYGDMKDGMVYISRLKAMKYKSDYKANGEETHKYQLSTLCKTRRAQWVYTWQRAVGIEMTMEEIREML